jgi:N-acetylmuramoyl-L-alanine amidase
LWSVLFFLTLIKIENISYFKLGNFIRLSIEVSQKSDFNFSAEKNAVKMMFKEPLILGKNNYAHKKKAIPFRMIVKGNEMIFIFEENFSVARYFVLPFPYKIIIDVSFNTSDIEDILTEREKKRRPKIVLDAGHGGKDPGTTHFNIREKDITLSFVKELADIIRKDGKFELILTRDRDEFLKLEERSGIANSVECDVFISLHVNYTKKPMVRGFEIFYFSKKFSKYALRVAEKENGVKLKEDDIVLFELFSSYKQENSRKLADFLKESLKDVGEVNRVEGAPFYVLAGTFCPSVLIELGFISNHEDRRKLISKSFRKTVAEKIYEGIKSFITYQLSYQNSYL